MESVYLNGGMVGATLDFSANTRYGAYDIAYDDAITGSSGGTPDFRWKFNNSTTEEASYSTTVNGTFSYGSALIPTITDVSADFDGSTTYLVPANSTLINTGTFTKRSVSFWFNTDTTGSGTYPCIWEEGGGVNWFTIYFDNGLIYANIGEGSATGGHATASVSTGTTYHCLVTVDLSLGSNNIKIYLNGALAGQATSSVGTDLAAHSGDIRIGFGAARNHLNTNNPYTVYDGRLQDFCYWYEDALTLSDASDIYLAGISVPLNLKNSGIWNLEAVYDTIFASYVPQPSSTFIGSYGISVAQTSYSFTTASIPAGLVVIAVHSEDGQTTSNPATSVTIGGVTATQAVAAGGGSSGNNALSTEFWYAVIGSSTTSVEVTFGGGTPLRCGIGVYTISNYTSSTPSFTGVDANVSFNQVESVSTSSVSGAILAAATSGDVYAHTWTGATEDYDNQIGGGLSGQTGASLSDATIQAYTITVTRDTTPAQGTNMAVAVWS